MATTKKLKDVTPEEQALAVASQNMQIIDETYGDNLPYDPGRLVGEVRFYLHQGVMAMLEAGRRLILLKEHEAHGNFMTCLEQIGISHEVARNMMRSAHKFLNGSGEPKSKLVWNLDSITKVYELAMMDDEDLSALEEGGTLAGKTLDDIQRMSPTELRTLLRKEREERRAEAVAQSEILAKKNERIDELEKANHKLASPYSWEPEVERLSVEIDQVWMKGAQMRDMIAHITGRIREAQDAEWNGAQYRLTEKLRSTVAEVLAELDAFGTYLGQGYIPNKLTYQLMDTRTRHDLLRQEFQSQFAVINAIGTAVEDEDDGEII